MMMRNLFLMTTILLLLRRKKKKNQNMKEENLKRSKSPKDLSLSQRCKLSRFSSSKKTKISSDNHQTIFNFKISSNHLLTYNLLNQKFSLLLNLGLDSKNLKILNFELHWATRIPTKINLTESLPITTFILINFRKSTKEQSL